MIELKGEGQEIAVLRKLKPLPTTNFSYVKFDITKLTCQVLSLGVMVKGKKWEDKVMKSLLKVDQVLPILYGLNVKYSKKYCFPGQKKIMSLLVEFRDLKISIASLNRWLRVLEDEEYIKRRRRIKYDKKRGTMFRSTLYHITKKGYNRLAISIKGVWDWFNSIKGNGGKNKKESKETPKKYFLEQVDQKVRDLAAGVFKKPIY